MSGILEMRGPLVKAVPDVFGCKPKSKYSLPKHLPDFETWQEAYKRRKSLVTALKKYRPEEKELIDCLEGCSKENRCRLLCCPICMRVLRHWFCDEVAPLVAAEEFRMITLVPDRHRHDIGTLHTFNPQHLIDDFRTGLKKLGLKNVIVFGSIDYCQEVILTENGQYTLVWCPHLHLMTNMTESDWNNLKVELKRYYPKAPNIKRPIKMVQIRSKGFEILKPVSYCIKSSVYSSSGPVNPNEKSADLIDTVPKRKKKGRMHGKFQAELASFHAIQRFKDRVILIGLKHVQKSIVQTVEFGSSHRS